jgi:hypothetical protein
VASDNDYDILNVERSKHNLDAYFQDYWISEAAKAYKPAASFVEDCAGLSLKWVTGATSLGTRSMMWPVRSDSVLVLC